MASNDSTKSGWSADNINNLLMNIIKQSNPDLTISGWKDIANRMAPLGVNENTCKKQWQKLRREFVERMGEEGTADKPATPARGKRAAAPDVDETGEATPKPKARKRATKPKVAKEDEPANETAAKVEDSGADGML